MPIKCILTEQISSGGSGGVTLSKIEITTPPSKVNYLSGESFDTTGMIVTATYNIGTIEIATAEVTRYVVIPTILTDEVTNVTINYSEGGVTRSAAQEVTVKRALTSITVAAPSKITYEYLDTLNTSGMVVTANYTDNTSATVTNVICTPTTFNTVSTQNITVSYTEDGITKETTFQVTVDRKSVAKPTWKSNLTYNTNNQSVVDVSYWNNYDTNYMTISGTTNAINAGSYIATFTLKNNYRWDDKSVTPLDVNWVINKINGSLSIDPTILSITGSNLSASTTITRSGTGTISYSPTSIVGLTMSLSSNTLTIIGDGSTAVPATEITISVAEDVNYTAPASQKITVSATYWEWGDESAEGDAAWWAGLKNWIQTATHEERLACEGKTKKMRLSTAVQGAIVTTMVCIGADQDGDKTLAFQTKTLLPSRTSFSDNNNAQWPYSIVKTICQDFYNYCPAKDSIKTVSKGTCPILDLNRKQTPTYNDETVFLPSEREMGLDSYSPLSVANSTTTKAECTYGYNEAYHYYTNYDNRSKFPADYQGNASGGTGQYWMRSRYFNSYNGFTDYVCLCGGYSSGYQRSSNQYYLAPAFVIG